MTKKEEIYKRIKIAGMLFFVSFVLAAGTVSGYLIGSYLQKKFAFPSFTIPISIIIGTLVSVVEAARIIRLAVRLDKQK